MAPKVIQAVRETARMLTEVVKFCTWNKGGRAMAGPHPNPSAWTALTHLLEDLGRHGVATIKDDAELPAPLHLLEQGA